MHQNRHRDVVWQVCDESLRRKPSVGVGELPERDVERVCAHHPQAALGGGIRLHRGDRAGQFCGEPVVDLDRGDARADLGEPERQRAEAGPDLDDPVTSLDTGEAHDLAHRVRVDDEVLPELLRRGDVEPLCELAHFERTEQLAAPLACRWLGLGHDAAPSSMLQLP